MHFISILCVACRYYSGLSVEPADDGIMVAGLNGIVDIAVEGFVVGGAEDVINAETETCLAIGESETAATLYETVSKTLGYGTTDIRNGCVIHVAADNHRIATIPLDIVVQHVGLTCTHAHRRGELSDNHSRLGLSLLVIHIASNHIIVALAVNYCQMSSLKVKVNDADGVVSYLEEEKSGTVALRGNGNLLLAEDGIA